MAELPLDQPATPRKRHAWRVWAKPPKKDGCYSKRKRRERHLAWLAEARRTGRVGPNPQSAAQLAKRWGPAPEEAAKPAKKRRNAGLAAQLAKRWGCYDL